MLVTKLRANERQIYYSAIDDFVCSRDNGVLAGVPSLTAFESKVVRDKPSATDQYYPYFSGLHVRVDIHRVQLKKTPLYFCL